MTTPESGQHGHHGDIQYEDFALTLESDGSGFRVRLLQSPYGGAEARFSSPFADVEMQELLAQLAAWRGGRDLESRAPEMAQGKLAETIGTALFESLFTGKVRELYLLSLGQVESQPDMGLRLRLVLNLDRPELAFLCGLPWELLFRPQTRNFFARDLRTPICRFLEVPQPSRALPPVERLRILVAMASPTDSQHLNLEAERQKIEDAWAQHPRVTVDFVEHAGIEDVYKKLRPESYEVLHFMGHGSFEEGKGVLLFENERGEGDPVAGEVLGESLRSIRSLRLVFLNACRSAAFPRQAGLDPYTGVANALVMRGVPAVIAMQFPISDEAAIRFSGAFYSSLAAGDPVDRAAAEGRLATYRLAPDSLEWATPALFLNVPDGRLFAPSEQEAETKRTPRMTLEPDSIVWADLQPLFVEDFTELTRGKGARRRMLGGSLFFGRHGAWTGILTNGSYVLVNDSKRDDIKYCYLGHDKLSLAQAPVSVEVALEAVAQDQDLAGAGLIYRFNPLSGSYYAFLLKPQQSFALFHGDAAGFHLIYSGKSAAIRVGELNRLSVLGVEHSLSLYINEQRVKTIEDNLPCGDLVGIVAVSRGRYRFDNFALFQPLC